MVNQIQLGGKKVSIGNQPPKNRRTNKLDINKILLYSAKKNNVNPILAYSTWYPETNSDSASGKSKGTLFVSAKIEIKNNKLQPHKGIILKIALWLKTIAVKFKDPENNKTGIKIKPNEIS